MNKKLTKLKIEALIITLLEVVLVGVFLTLYSFNVWNMNSVIKIEYIIYACFALAVLDGIFIWSMIYSFHKISKLNDLKTQDIIGSDINEAYLFSKVGVFLCDENGIILWVSDYFLENQMNFINQNIYDVFPKLNDFNKSTMVDTLYLNFNRCDYSVKFLKASNLFIFKDITDYENLSRYSREHSIVLGTILIDNYQDITLNDEDNNDLILQVRTEIIKYFKNYDVTIRHIKNDTYFAVCTFESLQKMERDKFAILENVKKLGEGHTVVPTISICFAYEFPDINKLNDSVNNGLQVALARGGDQVIISKFGSELKYYGGKTEASENRNKVKVRTLAGSLKTLILESDKVILMGHNEMDMDALGACLGVKYICDVLEKPSYILIEPKRIERKTLGALNSQFDRDQKEKFTISEKEALEKITPSTLLMVLDFCNPVLSLSKPVLDAIDKKAVIDHHRRGNEYIDKPIFEYIEPAASSTCELIAEMIKYGSYSYEKTLDSKIATIMLSGIYLDTNTFKSTSIGIRAFEGSMILKEYGADISKAYDLIKDEYEEYQLIAKIVETMKYPVAGVAVCVTEDSEIIDKTTLAKAANKCMEIKGIEAVFVIGRVNENSIAISARSDGGTNVQLILEKIGGGGHFNAAAASIKDKSVTEVYNKLDDIIKENIESARITSAKGE